MLRAAVVVSMSAGESMLPQSWELLLSAYVIVKFTLYICPHESQGQLGLLASRTKAMYELALKTGIFQQLL